MNSIIVNRRSNRRSTLYYSEHVGVARIPANFSVVALVPFEPQERILILEGQMVNYPTRYSVQIDYGLHLDLEVSRDLVHAMDFNLCGFLNHSCEPNAKIRGRELIAIRDIRPWDEITFNYNTTEYEIAFPFQCHCGSCRGRKIRGFKHLSTAERIQLRPLLAEYLKCSLDISPSFSKKTL
jgi:hypothetical protein